MREAWFAWLLEQASRIHEPMVRARKRALFAELKGDVLEIGPGNGVNLQYLTDAVQWTGYEPNRCLAKKIVVPSGGRLFVEEFSKQDGVYDAVISSLVLCSVREPAAVLRALHGSLRSGGRFFFMEHVGAQPGTALRRAQERWLPVWRFCAGGCHPNRDTGELIEAAGFEIQSLERFDLPLGLAGPHIMGVGIKR